MTKLIRWCAIGLILLPAAANAGEPNDFYAKIITKAEARFEPAEAIAGQTVKLKIELILAKGLCTYPTQQPDEDAWPYVNKITFPKDGLIAFSNKIKEPEKPSIPDEPLFDVKEFRFYPGGGVWE